MKVNILKRVSECDICQCNKGECVKSLGLLQPLYIPTQKWKEISMDSITRLPQLEGKDAIVVVVDRLTKYTHFRGTQTTTKASQIAKVYMKEIHRLHEFPNIIVSDRDPEFRRHFWQDLFKLAGTKLHMSTIYHPQTVGQTEAINKCLEGYL